MAWWENQKQVMGGIPDFIFYVLFFVFIPLVDISGKTIVGLLD